MEHTLIEETPIMEPVPEVKLPHSEPKIKKESFVCDCGYEFSLNLDKTSKVICPWCGRKQQFDNHLIKLPLLSLCHPIPFTVLQHQLIGV